MDELWNDLRFAFSGLSNGVYCVADALEYVARSHYYIMLLLSILTLVFG